jgi:hypothetical protein
MFSLPISVPFKHRRKKQIEEKNFLTVLHFSFAGISSCGTRGKFVHRPMKILFRNADYGCLY